MAKRKMSAGIGRSGIVRKLSPWLGAGYLLQATGCDLTPASLAESFILLFANTLLADVIFGVFNVPF